MEPLTLDALLDLCDEDRQEMRKLAQLYVRSVTSHLQKLTRAADEKKSADIETIAHSAAGASIMLGLTALASCFKKMELLGREKNLAPVPAALDETKKIFSLACEFFDSHQLLKKS